MKKFIATVDKSEGMLQLPEPEDSTKSLVNIDKSADLDDYPTNISRLHLRLNTIGNTRRSMAAVVRAVNAGRLSHEEGRSYAFLIQTLSSCFKTEQELTIQKQIAELRKMVEALERDGKL